MNVFDHLKTNYNYYPNVAIELSIIAYEFVNLIKPSIEIRPKMMQEVVWGPAEATGELGIPYAKIFITKVWGAEEYFVVIQGTNPFSLDAWTEEDFDVDVAVPFATLIPGNPTNIPEDVVISQGTFNGMQDLLALPCPNSGNTLTSFLQNASPEYVYVTGHSLGGTLTPPMFMYLNAMLFGGGEVENMAMWSFAGLTPGGTMFNNYLNSVLLPNNQDFEWRIQNSLDVAPFLWGDHEAVKEIYSIYDLNLDPPLSLVIDALFLASDLSGASYGQAQAGVVLPGTFAPVKIGASKASAWYDQASHQHSSKESYQGLVNTKYPWPSFND